MDNHTEDPANDVIERGGRVALTAASAVARKIAERLRERAEERRRAEKVEADRLRSRWDAERATAGTQLVAADRGWVSTASPEQAAQVWSTASGWAQVDGEFVAGADELRNRIHERWGVDVDPGSENSLRLAADAQTAQARRDDVAREADEAQAGAVVGGTADEVDALDRAAQHRDNAEAAETAAASFDGAADEAGYDTDARRSDLGQRAMDAGVDAETTGGRVRAADANAKPVKNATRQGEGKKKARATRSTAQRTRADQLSR